MRALERKLRLGTVEPFPVYIPFGSNILGRRFKRGSITITPEELNKALTSNHPDCLKRVRDYLRDIEHTYYD